MKKLIFFILLIVFLVLVGGGIFNLVGMVPSDIFSSPVTYTCTDNDATSSNPIMVKGIVTETSSKGEKGIYNDGCISKNTVREYSCDPENNRHTFLDHSCLELGLVCKLGRCMVG